MSTKIQALLWEFWQSTKWRMLMAFCGMLVLPGIITLSNPPWNSARSLSDLLSIPRSDFQPMGWPGQMTTIWVNSLVCSLSIGYGVGYPKRHYTLPVTTPQLTCLRMVPAAIICAGLHLAVAGLFNWACGSELPYAGPALTYAVGILFSYAAIASVYDRENLRAIAGLGCGIIEASWIFSHYPTGWHDKIHFDWTHVSIAETVILTLTAWIAWQIAKGCFTLDRKGRGWAHPRIRSEELDPTVPARPRTVKRFRSTFAALFWQEWRQDGWLWPLAIICTYGIFALTVLCVCLREAQYRHSHNETMPSIQGDSIVVGTYIFMIFTAGLPWFLGAVTIQGRKSQADKPLPTSISTLPVTDVCLAWVSTIRCLCSIAMSWCCMIAIGIAAMLVFCACGGTIDWTYFQRASDRDLWQAAAMIMLLVSTAWMSTGVGTATGLSGRSWIAYLPISIIPIWICTVLLASFVGSSLSRSTNEFCLLVFITVVLFGLTSAMVAAYVRGWNRRIIGIKTVLTATLLVVIADGGLMSDYYLRAQLVQQPEGTFAVVWRLAMFLALAVAPPAVVPLAVHFNRHR